MKKNIALLLALILTLVCAQALAETDLQAIEDANTMYAITGAYRSIAQKTRYYDLDTGDFTNGLDVYITNNPDTGATYTYIYSDGNVEVLGYGGDYGYIGFSQEPYIIGMIGSAYEEIMDSIDRQNMGEFVIPQTLIAETVLEDGRLSITAEGQITEEVNPYGGQFIGSTMVAHYTVNPESFLIEASEVFIRGEDGVEKHYISSEIVMNPTVELPFDVSVIKQPESIREVHIIINPGTQEESEQVIEVPINLPVALYPPAGYEMYDDYACEKIMLGDSRDENGNFPIRSTFYCGPQKDGM